MISKAAIWAATGILGGGVAGGLTYAAVSTPATASGAAPAAAYAAGPGGHNGDGQGHARMGMRRFGGLAGRLEHGELTLRTQDGGDKTVDVQRGSVTAVSPTSISVKSLDGFTATYAVTSATKIRTGHGQASIGDVHDGDTVFVLASAGNALRILDRVNPPENAPESGTTSNG